MGILSGPEILRQMGLGNIRIEPFDERLLNPNSVNLRLSDTLKCCDEVFLDVRKRPRERTIIIPPEGFVLQPGIGYLASTLEWTETKCYVPIINGRSTLGRCFLTIHQTAGFGDCGFRGRWTLELMATALPVRVYAGIAIAQIYFQTITGELAYYQGRYQDQDTVRGPEPLMEGSA